MGSFEVSFLGVAATFGGALVGLFLQRFLPQDHLSKEMKETVHLGSGVVATLAALVLGLLVSSSKTTFDTISSEITESGAKVLLLNRILVEYGAESKLARAQLLITMKYVNEALWPEENGVTASTVELDKFKGMEPVIAKLNAITPSTDGQRWLMSRALQCTADLQQTRWLLVEQVRSVLPTPFLVILLSWLAVLYVSFGLFAPRNVTSIVVLATCAICMSSALFVIYELNRPLDGLIRVSSHPIRTAIQHLEADANS